MPAEILGQTICSNQKQENGTDGCSLHTGAMKTD